MLDYEAEIRISVFLGVLFLVGIWETLFPRRQRVASKMTRWINNLGLIFLNTLFLRYIFPFLAIGAAIFAAQEGWGVGAHILMPFPLKVLIGVIVLDLLIYFQHVIFHKTPLLWRLHRMHHIDPDLDVTSGARFHPIEIGLSMVIKMGIVIVFGIPVEAVLIFEVILNASAMFNHGNIVIPLPLDKVLRLAIVTPDMHRVHHSVYRDETDTNYGFFLSWWDKIFGTYKAQPKLGHDKMTIGIGTFNDNKYLKLHWLLAVPFIQSK